MGTLDSGCIYLETQGWGEREEAPAGAMSQERSIMLNLDRI